MDLSLIDAVETVSNDEAVEMARRLIREEGLLSSILFEGLFDVNGQPVTGG